MDFIWPRNRALGYSIKTERDARQFVLDRARSGRLSREGDKASYASQRGILRSPVPILPSGLIKLGDQSVALDGVDSSSLSSFRESPCLLNLNNQRVAILTCRIISRYTMNNRVGMFLPDLIAHKMSRRRWESLGAACRRLILAAIYVIFGLTYVVNFSLIFILYPENQWFRAPRYVKIMEALNASGVINLKHCETINNEIMNERPLSEWRNVYRYDSLALISTDEEHDKLQAIEAALVAEAKRLESLSKLHSRPIFLARHCLFVVRTLVQIIFKLGWSFSPQRRPARNSFLLFQ